jgi:hypothetical protein
MTADFDLAKLVLLVLARSHSDFVIAKALRIPIFSNWPTYQVIKGLQPLRYVLVLLLAELMAKMIFRSWDVNCCLISSRLSNLLYNHLWQSYWQITCEQVYTRSFIILIQIVKDCYI